VSTSRDSAVMRVIAGMTIFFLPATFTATFFSTTFFSFNTNMDGKVYSAWLWLYFAVTVVLTAVVVVGTWMLWKSKERDIERQAARLVVVEETKELKHVHVPR
jgi:heme exporter protein D